MPSKSRAPGIDHIHVPCHPTDSARVRVWHMHTDAVSHVILHFEF
jgi:hypothetical protein